MKFPGGMFTKYMVLDLSLAGGRKRRAPREVRCSPLTGIFVFWTCLTRSLPLLPHRVNRRLLQVRCMETGLRVIASASDFRVLFIALSSCNIPTEPTYI